MSTALLVTMGLVASRIGGVFMIMPAFGARCAEDDSDSVHLDAHIDHRPDGASGNGHTHSCLLLFAIATEVLVGVIIGGVVSFMFGAWPSRMSLSRTRSVMVRHSSSIRC